MRLNRVTLREIHIPLIAPFQTSFGISTLRRIVLIEADVDGVIGWGEATVGEDPYYCYETVETGWHILRDHADMFVPIANAERVIGLVAITNRIDAQNLTQAGTVVAIQVLEPAVGLRAPRTAAGLVGAAVYSEEAVWTGCSDAHVAVLLDGDPAGKVCEEVDSILIRTLRARG